MEKTRTAVTEGATVLPWWLCSAKSLPSCPTLCDPTLWDPWASLGRNTGVGCHCLLQCMKGQRKWSCSAVSDWEWPHGLQPTRLLRPREFPGRSTRVGCHCLLHPWWPSGKESTCNAGEWENAVRSLGQEHSLEKGIATHSSILAWRIPWTEKPSRQQSTGSQRVGHDWSS